MKLLVIGSGGREHALAWKLAQSARVTEVIVAPGNAGTATEAKCRNAAVKVTDLDGLLALAQHEAVALTVVGPEVPLVAGVVDRFRAASLRIFGPTAAAAQLEGSKAFAKDFLARHGIPTAFYEVHSEVDAALAYVRAKGAPIVIKADGLAAGKGVVIAASRAEAVQAVEDCFDGRFGSAGSEIVIEAFLDGEEASVFAISDGRHVLPFGTAQDHKRVGDGDLGPNTGGMGAISPAPAMTPALQDEVMARIIRPTVAAMAAEGCPFKGVLYAGIILTAEGPKLLEYNVRFGDPECQVLMLRLKSDLLPALIAAADGVLDTFDLRWRPGAAATVVLANRGYPGPLEPGGAIAGIAAAEAVDGVVVFHAATRRDGDRLVPAGGRVLNVTATGDTLGEAIARAYQAVDRIVWPGGFCRRDIGARALAR